MERTEIVSGVLMGSKLYVGNLPFRMDEETLRALFTEAGHSPTEVAVITDRVTGRSRGFGFVTFDTPQAAQAAAQEMNGRDCDGRALVVNEARERAAGGGGGGGGFGGRGGGGGGGGRRPFRR
jgi:RNA recognition motif-containing protein